jgi:azurin
VSFNLLNGGWGQATGSAWWDDLSLVRLGPSTGAGPGADPADAVAVVARNLTKFSAPPDVSAVRDLASKSRSAVAAAVLKLLAPETAVAAAEESEDDLRKTHQVFHVKSTVGTLMYDVTEISAAAGKPIAIIYENPDALQHNLIVGRPGSYENLGAAADKMMTAADGFAKSFVPDSPDVLASCKLLDPGGKAIIKFTPDKPGDYPYLCTFPAHWRITRGVIKVK